MLYCISGFRPHSSPDPFGATLPPGEGMGFFDRMKRPRSLVNGGDVVADQILSYRSVMERIFSASSLLAKPGRARQVQLAVVSVPGWFMRPSMPNPR